MTAQPPASTREVAQRMEREFLEMPGLALTTPQAERLWHLDHALCVDALEYLVSAHMLARTVDGRYVSVDRERPIGREPHARG